MIERPQADRSSVAIEWSIPDPYPEVAEIIGTDVDSARPLVARARKHVPRAPTVLLRLWAAARRAGSALLRRR
jgi:hypothetical protein